NVRRLSLSTLNSAAHNKPYLIRNVLDQLLPLLYEETLVKESLIHMVEMGPFKHKVDDGLSDQHDIAILSHTMLIQLAHVAPTAISQKLDETVEPLKAPLSCRMKDNAVKSEIDK
ncbi:1603_t:CDS:2, partial [Gigaspora rosea]